MAQAHRCPCKPKGTIDMLDATTTLMIIHLGPISHRLTWVLKRTVWLGRTSWGVWVSGWARRLREPVAWRGGWCRTERLLERVWVGGVVRHEGLTVQGGTSELGQEAELGVVLAVSWYQHRRQNWEQRERETGHPELGPSGWSGAANAFPWPFVMFSSTSHISTHGAHGKLRMGVPSLSRSMWATLSHQPSFLPHAS